MTETELVVLLDDDGREIGTAPKSTVHDTETALHLAFSCHVVDDEGQVLVTRRALTKRTWPGVWTNSFCGHPRPGEDPLDAVRRHARHELYLEIRDVELVLADFRYRAIDASGVVEHEICPVYIARAASEPVLNPDEAMDAQWIDPRVLGASLSATPWAFSPWFVLQAERMPLFSPLASTPVPT